MTRTQICMILGHLWWCQNLWQTAWGKRNCYQ